MSTMIKFHFTQFLDQPSHNVHRVGIGMMLSDGVGMCFGDAILLADSFGPPIDIEHKQCNSKNILVGHLRFPRFVGIGPGNIRIVGKFRLISLIEILLPLLLLALDGIILVKTTPVVVVVIPTTSQCLS
jgi:hypothetical protein